ncbi:hypothetical protein BQ8482_220197 [Mesorhizobium delmotii]|uniref:Uncharacterized protein n=3 Tax=Mesorhizobium TaxID=68287 RepID=A0A2P9ALM0_9HYPH|nr:hypothetical protein BQ8482_220197 [Mesorhizobium delmotii]
MFHSFKSPIPSSWTSAMTEPIRDVFSGFAQGLSSTALSPTLERLPALISMDLYLDKVRLFEIAISSRNGSIDFHPSNGD